MANGVVIAIVSGKGGVGKTITALNLAKELAVQGYNVGVIDMDVGQSNTDQYVGRKGQVVHYADQITEVRKYSMLGIPVRVTDKQSYALITFNLKHDPTILEDDRMVQALLEGAKESFDYVLLDAPAGIGLGTLRCLEYADTVFGVLSGDLPYNGMSIRNLDSLLKILYEMRATGYTIEGKTYYSNVTSVYSILQAVTVDEAHVNGDIIRLYYELIDTVTKQAGEPILGFIPYNRHMIGDNNKGVSGTMYSTTSSVTKAYKRIVNRIIHGGTRQEFLDEMLTKFNKEVIWKQGWLKNIVKHYIE